MRTEEQPRPALRAERVVPIFRIFDVAKAREFYVEYLGFSVDWEHRFEAQLPLYMQLSRGELTLHLSEHHGDGSPGARVRVLVRELEELHAELGARGYRYAQPGIEHQPWGERTFRVIDPFGNHLTFYTPD